MADVFVVGSINQDLVLKVERRPEPGETVTDAELSTHNGGKGANQAAAAALLGASVAFLGRVGDDEFGGPLVRALAEKGVDMSLVERDSGTVTGTAFITVTPDGENAIVVAPGANRRLTPEDVDAASDDIRQARVLVAQMEVPLESVLRAAEIADAGGTRVVLNLAPPREVPSALLEKLDPLVVNEHEAAFMLGTKVEGQEGARAASRELLALGPRSVVITLGPAGALVADRETVTHVPAPEVEVVDTTGAGDAFVGALVARLARG
ncbi:MAG TPA: ribokinase, partial [Rubrobacteraceae bacterium]|nr:ribokinase [Rubrobacteraceae bacterium]